MAVRLECRDQHLVGLQTTVSCGTSEERNNRATKSEHSKLVVKARRTSRQPNKVRAFWMKSLAYFFVSHRIADHCRQRTNLSLQRPPNASKKLIWTMR
jgi:hypothetical protein